MLTIFVAALFAAPTAAEADQLDQFMNAYQSCLVSNARTLHARNAKLNPERAIAAAKPACEAEAAKTVAVAKAQYSQRDSNGNVMVVQVDAVLSDLQSAAVNRYRASQRIWDSRSQVWSTAK